MIAPGLPPCVRHLLQAARLRYGRSLLLLALVLSLVSLGFGAGIGGLGTAWAQSRSTELELKAVLLGRFASYVQWPVHGPRDADATGNTPVFTIAVVGSNPFGEHLTQLYADKTIQSKPVRIHYAAGVQDVGAADLMFIALPTAAARQEAIIYAWRHNILSVSDAKGFAEAGGIIQLNFVGQNAQIKINYNAALRSGLHIGAPLLSIATVLREGAP